MADARSGSAPVESPSGAAKGAEIAIPQGSAWRRALKLREQLPSVRTWFPWVRPERPSRVERRPKRREKRPKRWEKGPNRGGWRTNGGEKGLNRGERGTSRGGKRRSRGEWRTNRGGSRTGGGEWRRSGGGGRRSRGGGRRNGVQGRRLGGERRMAPAALGSSTSPARGFCLRSSINPWRGGRDHRACRRKSPEKGKRPWLGRSGATLNSTSFSLRSPTSLRTADRRCIARSLTRRAAALRSWVAFCLSAVSVCCCTLNALSSPRACSSGARCFSTSWSRAALAVTAARSCSASTTLSAKDELSAQCP